MHDRRHLNLEDLARLAQGAYEPPPVFRRHLTREQLIRLHHWTAFVFACLAALAAGAAIALGVPY